MAGRSIAPRPVDEPGNADNPLAPLTSAVPQLGSSQGRTAAVDSRGVRRKITSACLGCQQRRVRCDGTQPCSACVKTNRECSYTPQLDGRSIKRKYHEVQRDQDLLNDLLLAIRSSGDEDISRIISLVRSDTPIDEVKACIQQQLDQIRPAGEEGGADVKQPRGAFDAIQSASGDRARTMQRPDVLEIQRLADRPLHHLPATPWTRVTDDDALVSNLISLWLTWDQGWYDWMDVDSFLSDMKAASLDSVFCSPFLVNAILAWACPYSDYKEARTSNGNVSPLMVGFLDEAKRLAEVDATDETYMTTTQGLIFLYGALCMSGQDRARRYMLQALGIVRDLMSSHLATRRHPDPQVASTLSDAINRTCWGVYMLSTHALGSLLMPQRMDAPWRPKPSSVLKPKPPQPWKPYPYSEESVQCRRDEFFDWGCDLAIIEAELSQLLFDAVSHPSRNELETGIQRLYNDTQGKVVALLPRLNLDTAVWPSMFSHRVRIYTVILRMFMRLREPDLGANPEVVAMAQERCADTALEIAQLIGLFSRTWTVSVLPPIFLGPGFVSLSVLLEVPDISGHSQEVTDLCVVLRAMSRRWPMAMGLLRTIQLDARKRHLKLPPETDELFREFETFAWRQRELKVFDTLYPHSDATKAAHPTVDAITIGKYLKDMELSE